MSNILINTLKQFNWTVVECIQDDNSEIIKSLPNDLNEILNQYNVVSNSSDTAWFFTLSEINGNTDSEFKWDEFRLQSLESAISESQKITINQFWDNHFLFCMSVKNGYSYLAICIEGENKNKIIYGSEPEYEEYSILFNTFNEFSLKLIMHLRGDLKYDFFDDFF